MTNSTAGASGGASRWRHRVQERPEKGGGRELLPAVEHAAAPPSGGGRSRDGVGGREERIRRTGGERIGKVYLSTSVSIKVEDELAQVVVAKCTCNNLETIATLG
jgi:hypothetical protein